MNFARKLRPATVLEILIRFFLFAWSIRRPYLTTKLDVVKIRPISPLFTSFFLLLKLEGDSIIMILRSALCHMTVGKHKHCWYLQKSF